MTATAHQDHRYSITVKTLDPAILYCLRALADYSQKTGNTRIAWGGTKREDWEINNKTVKFHFSDPNYRKEFIAEAKRVLPNVSWETMSILHDACGFLIRGS
jgi:hypothetical protein